jgi:ribonuclease HII
MDVVVRTKADRDCVSVAAASVVAKVERDNHMIALAEGLVGYGVEGHKGYASASHIAAVRNLGPSSEHRLTWLTKILANDLDPEKAVSNKPIPNKAVGPGE